MDNITAVVFINEIGGTVSNPLNIILVGNQFFGSVPSDPDVDYCRIHPREAESTSRLEKHTLYGLQQAESDRFKSLIARLGPCNVDLFADRFDS